MAASPGLLYNAHTGSPSADTLASNPGLALSVVASTMPPPHPQWTAASLWRRYRVDVSWLSLYVVANITVFWLRSRQYPHDPCVGFAPAIAKGSAEAVLFNCFLTLLCVCHRVLDRLRRCSCSFPASFYASPMAQRPLEMHRQLHVLTGSAIVVLAIVHSIAWGAIVYDARHCTLAQWRDSSLSRRATRILRDESSLWQLLLATFPMATGVALLVCVLALLPFVVARVRRAWFQAFARVHCVVLVPFVVLLLIHGAAQWSSALQAPLWLLPAIAIYALERRSRLSCRTMSAIVSYGIDSSTNDAKAQHLSLYVIKTPRFDRCFKPGMFIYLQVPAISSMEWHPFSVASSPDDPLVELRVRVVGDWTRALFAYLASLSSTDSSVAHSAGELLPATIPVRLDGPFGTPTMQYTQYDCVALVALGVGISPFLSVLRQQFHTWRGLLKLRHVGVGVPTTEELQLAPKLSLVWVVREIYDIQWLVDLLHEFDDVLLATRDSLDIQVFVTSKSYDHESFPSITTQCNFQIHYDGERPHWASVVAAWSTKSSVDGVPLDCKRAIFASGSRAATSAIKRAVACQHHSQRIDVFAEIFH